MHRFKRVLFWSILQVLLRFQHLDSQQLGGDTRVAGPSSKPRPYQPPLSADWTHLWGQVAVTTFHGLYLGDFSGEGQPGALSLVSGTLWVRIRNA